MSDALLDRLARLRRHLAGGAVVPASALAEAMGVSERTIHRDVERLRRLDDEVEAVRGRAGGYRMCPTRTMGDAPLVLDTPQAGALVLALAGVTGGQGRARRRAGNAVLGRLPADVADRVDALRAVINEDDGPESGESERVQSGVGADRSRPDKVSVDRLVDVATALRDQRRLHLRYVAADGARTERTVDPHGLVLHHRRWYLAVHDHLRSAQRLLRVDRIEAVLDAGPGPAAPPLDEVRARVRRTLELDAWRYRVRIVVDADEARARRLVGRHRGEVEPIDDDHARWTIGAEDLAGMARWLAALGVPVRVEEPAELRDELRDLAARLTTWATDT